MAYDELLHDRIRQAFRDKQVNAEEKYMMGGVCYLVDRKMCAGIVRDQLMVRIAPEIYDEALKKPGCRVMDFTKRPMKGFVFVEPEGTDLDTDLEYWIGLALEFNPRAKSSGKKAK
jgi:TfoX/Sxy family transcriptional regulator of competence genes